MSEERHFPQLGAGAIVLHQNQLLLVRRGRAPGEGLWSIPGGKVRAGESIAAAAEREILEETGVTIRAGEVIYHFEYIEHADSGALRYHYVVLDIAGEYLAGEPQAGDDAAEAAWVPLDHLDGLALNESSRRALQQFYPEAFSQ